MTTLVLLAILAALGYAAFYLIGCAIFPFGRCRRRRCEGGRVYSRANRKVFRECRRCEGTGKRVRIGRRVYEYLRGEREAGNR
ncbi:hypothetical protein Aca07nite_27850 [Actinoplanes capillaceus]|uniref:Uncharacterized protein n=1 Tax=Actinoplanes campanulatus TaxID=113559 RepID=A0ABQ3WGZ4_9ACTN|nr:hypothetical protein [Actinoplanes capillaceus]GID45510.1 hypothetical protein Aca07nite_27850 [Actinoplanes capillaceus]